MVHIDIITALPELLRSFFEYSILKKAQQNNVAQVELISLREFGIGKSKQIDDYAFGGKAGMVLMMEPLVNAYRDLIKKRTYQEVIYLSPDGQQFDQKMANSLSLKGNLLLICGHYKGIDERFREHFVSREISIGDYVLSGGELAAAVVADAIIRLIPGAMNDETSALTDSFQDGLLAPPVYTRPANFEGMEVPEVLRSGNFKKIEEWQLAKSLERTKKRRPDLLL